MGKLKGNAIVGQSGGPTAAINATLAGVVRGVLASECIDKLYGAYHGVEGLLDGEYCLLNELVGDESSLELLENTPAAALGSCRMKLPKLGEKDEVYEKLFKLFEELDIKYFFYIGGNDSMDTVAKVSEYAASINSELVVMGVPKTIDNDLCGTDHTPGYGSAAKFIATVMQEMLRDTAVYRVKAVTIVEIMGRDAGWLTAAAALPRKYCGVAPDLVYLPETEFSYEGFIEDINECFKKKPNVVVAVSEGVRDSSGRYVGEGSQSGTSDVFGHKYLAGTGKALEELVREKIGCKVRSVELNLPQRCASHSASLTDLKESVAVGRAAVACAETGESAKMMCFERNGDKDAYSVSCVARDIADIANKIRYVPREFINERGNNVTDECIDYIMPLILGEVSPSYEHGLPVHITLK